MKKALLFFLIIFSFLYGNKIIEVQNCYSSWRGTSCNDCINNYYKAEKTIKDALNDVTDDNGAEIVICKRKLPYKEYSLYIDHDNIYIHSNTNNPNDVVIESNKYHIFKITDRWIKNLKIEGLSLDVKKSKKKAIANDAGGSNWLLKNLVIKSKGYGIYNNAALQNSIIEDVNITSKKTALKLYNSSNILIKDVNITSDTDYAIYSKSAQGEINITSDTQNILNGANGIYFNGGEQNYYVEKSKIETTASDSAPVSAKEANNLVVKNCDLSSSDKGSGVHISGSVNSLDFENNYIHDIKCEGLYANTVYNESNIISNVFNGGNYGIYLSDVDNKINILNNNIIDFKSAGIYLKNISNSPYIEKNFIDGGEAGIYIKNLSNKAYVKSNVIKNASGDSGIHLLENSSSVGSEVLYNCFINNKDYQVYNLDESAVFDDGEKGNYWSDWSGSGPYIITKYGQDNHPLNNCDLFLLKPLVNYKMDECKWNGTTGEVKDSSGYGYNGTAKGGANTETNESAGGGICRVGKLLNNGNYIETNKAPELSSYTFTAWVKAPNGNYHPIFIKTENVDNAWRESDDIELYIGNGFTVVHNRHNGGKFQYTYVSAPPNNVWFHLAVTYDAKSKDLKIYYNGELKKEKTNFTAPLNTQNKMFFGKEGQYYLNGYLDEVKIFNTALTASQIKTIYDNELADKNYDRSKRNCPICNQSGINYSFNAVTSGGTDAVRDWDNNLTTQIVNKLFNLWILSKDENNSVAAVIQKVGIYLYPNSECNGDYLFKTICENNCSNTNANGETEIKNININNAYKCARVYIKGRLITSLSNEYNETNSTDDFAIRPKSFELKVAKKAIANKDFDVNISLLDNNNNLIDYNGTLNLQIDLNATKNACNQDDRTILKAVNFTDGKADIEVNYSNVADLNVSVRENTPIFANVDKGDGVSTNLEIEKNLTQLKVIPKYFEVNTTLGNFDKKFTYLDKNLSIYTVLDINLTAKGEGNITLTNYSDKCYGSEVNLSFNLEYNQIPSLNTLITNENNFSTDEINSTLNSFSKGVSNKEIKFNYDRNCSNPIAPFEVNISKVNLVQKDTNNSILNPEGNATFYYGNIFMKDIITTKNDFNISQPILIYDDNSSDGYKPETAKEILLDWYQNTYNKRKDANISVLKVTKGYIYQNSDIIPSSDINVSIIDINDSINIEVKRYNSNINFAVVHIIDTNASHLWYSKYGNEYNISKGSSCVNHFCFTITWPKNSENNGVISGDTNGTKADVNKSNDTRKGVKIFR